MLKTALRILVAGAMVAVATGQSRAQENFQFSQTSAVLNGGGGQGDCGSSTECGDCISNDCCEQPCIGNWRDNTVVFAATDAWSNIGDGVIALGSPFGAARTQGNYGVRFGSNTGFGLGDSRVRAQVGSSYGAYDLKGRTNFTGATSASAVEQQIFATAGLYKRSDILNGDAIAWGVVYDYMYDSDWGAQGNSNLNFGQIRSIFGYALSESNEVGISSTLRAQSDSAALVGFTASRIHAVDQANIFWHHNWQSGGDTWLSVGAADSPTSWTLGFAGQAPLSRGVSLFTSANYYIPGSATGAAGATEEIWNVTAGLSISLGGKAYNRTVSGNAGMPLLNVADNGTFALQR